MARRRVRARNRLGLGETPNIAGVDTLEGLSDVAALADVAEDGGLTEDEDLRGTADLVQQEEAPIEPESPYMTPTYPERYEQLPPGLEALTELDDQSEEPSMKPRVDVEEEQPSDYQDPLEAIRMATERDPSLLALLPEETRMALQETPADPYRRFVPEQEQEVMAEPESQPQAGFEDPLAPEEQAIPPAVEESFASGPMSEVTEQDLPVGGMDVVQGVVEVARNDPSVVEQVERLYGSNLPPEAWEQIQLAESALSKNIEALDSQEKAFKERLERDQSTDLDKVAIGVAIALPVILGLMYGKDAFFASLGGAFEGLSQDSKNRQDRELQTLDKLGTLQKGRGELQAKHQELKSTLLGKMENPKIKKLLRDNDVVNVVENADGSTSYEAGKDGIIIGDKVGISAKDPNKSLYYDLNVIRNDEDAAEFQKNSSEARKAISSALDGSNAMSEIMDVMTAIKEQNPGMLKALAQGWDSVTGKIPGYEALTVEIVGSDGKVKKVQALPMLRQKITAMQDVYNKEFLKQSRLTEGIIQHYQDVFGDPTKIASWMRSDYDTMLEQAQQFQNMVNQRSTDNLVGVGFLREPIEKVLPTSGLNIIESPSQDLAEIEKNPEKFKSKIRKG